MWQMGSLGPMLGQARHFLQYNPGKSEYAERRYGTEAARLYGVLDMRLSGRNYLAGSGRGTYTIVGMAVWSWVYRFEWQHIDSRLSAGLSIVSAYRRAPSRPDQISSPALFSPIPSPEKHA